MAQTRKTHLDRRSFSIGSVALLGLASATKTMASDPMMIEDFTDGAAKDWRYVSDRVMGGVSNGDMQMGIQGGDRFARLSGTVSTENNGGFIQMRRVLETPFSTFVSGLKLRLRGNGERYYIHLRPKVARRPWHYFAASFDTSGAWEEISLPWSSFTAQGGLQAAFEPTEITSIGVVAYGADYEAQLDVAWIIAE